jgi:predicted transcriptional regulator
LREKNSNEANIVILLTLSRGAASRRRILNAIIYHPKNCNQLSKELCLDWWTIKKHVHLLEKEGIIAATHFGNSKFFGLTQKGIVLTTAIVSSNDELVFNRDVKR